MNLRSDLVDHDQKERADHIQGAVRRQHILFVVYGATAPDRLLDLSSVEREQFERNVGLSS